MNILIADDHEIVRKGLQELLAQGLPEATFGESKDAEQVLQQVGNDSWDLLILDITLPGRSGLDVLKDLKLRKPELPVLVLSMHPETQYGKRVLKAGASGYMNKDCAPDELINAIRKILSGRRYVSAVLAEKLALDLAAGAEKLPHERLSDREIEVLRMLASGKSVSQIAEILHLSVTTVSTYRARILEKLNMTTTAELMHYALSDGLIL
jgi:two-component system, NarL family, invasion response regulator UvrY